MVDRIWVFICWERIINNQTIIKLKIWLLVNIIFCASIAISAEPAKHLQLKQQAEEFLGSYKQDKYAVERLDELEKASQKLIKSLQTCENQAENEIDQLAEIRDIDALNSDAQDSTSQEDAMLPQETATQEVDRRINETTKRLITCRLKFVQMEEARLEILAAKQKLWVDELTSRQNVWRFIKAKEFDFNVSSLNQILPLNIGYLVLMVLGFGFYLIVLWRNYNDWFKFKSLDFNEINLVQYAKKLIGLHAVLLLTSIVYFFWANDNKVHGLVLSLSLLVRDAFVLLPLKLTIDEDKKPWVNRFMVVSTLLIVLLSFGWNGVNFKQNFGLGWLVEYGHIITPLVLASGALLAITCRYLYLIINPNRDRFIPYLISILAVISFLAFTLTYAQGAQYILIISIGMVFVHGLLRVINAIRKVALTHKILNLKQDEDYDGSNFSFPFWVSLITTFASAGVGLIILSYIGGVSEEAYKQVSFLFNEGFDLGSIRIVPKNILISLIVVGVVIYSVQKIKYGIENQWFDKSRVRDSSREVISMVVWYIGLTVAIFAGLSIAGFDLSNLAIIAGALSVGIGFGLQNIVSNFVSGLILLFERPVTRGDWVEVGDTVGLIEKVKIRATRIRTFDNAEILVPNSELLSHHVTNWTLSNSIGRITVKVGVAYGSDVNQVLEILNDIASNHDQIMQREPYKHKVLFREFGDSSLNFELRVMIKNIKQFLDVENDLHFAIDAALKEAEISIPFPQRDLHIIDSSVIKVETPHPEEEAGKSEKQENPKDNDSTQVEKEQPQKPQKPEKPEKSVQAQAQAQAQSSNSSPDSVEDDKDDVEKMIEEDERRKEEEVKAEKEKAKQASKEKLQGGSDQA